MIGLSILMILCLVFKLTYISPFIKTQKILFTKCPSKLASKHPRAKLVANTQVMREFYNLLLFKML